MPVEYENGVGYATQEEASALSEFAFEKGTYFVRWHPWGDERAGDDVWVVKSRSFQYTVSWIRERDNIPTIENHRRYTLLSRETFDESEVSEADLLRGEWREVDLDDDWNVVLEEGEEQ